MLAGVEEPGQEDVAHGGVPVGEGEERRLYRCGTTTSVPEYGPDSLHCDSAPQIC